MALVETRVAFLSSALEVYLTKDTTAQRITKARYVCSTGSGQIKLAHAGQPDIVISVTQSGERVIPAGYTISGLSWHATWRP